MYKGKYSSPQRTGTGMIALLHLNYGKQSHEFDSRFENDEFTPFNKLGTKNVFDTKMLSKTRKAALFFFLTSFFFFLFLSGGGESEE